MDKAQANRPDFLIITQSIHKFQGFSDAFSCKLFCYYTPWVTLTLYSIIYGVVFNALLLLVAVRIAIVQFFEKYRRRAIGEYILTKN
jgi:hypothetical protein